MEEFMRENGLTIYEMVEVMNGFKMGTFTKEIMSTGKQWVRAHLPGLMEKSMMENG